MKQLSSQETSYPQWLDRKEYPFKSNYFQLSAGRMHYVDEGYGDPIVMVHGNPGWSFEFRTLIKELSATHRCIAPDHIGFGLSDKPYNWDYLPIHHAENFEKFMDSLQLSNITLIVNDWGGPIGLSYAIRHPEKIKKLIILNTWLWSVKGDKHFEKFSNLMGGGFGRFMIKNFNMFGKVVVKKAVGDKSRLTKKIHRHYYDHLEKRKDRKGCYVFPHEIVHSAVWLDSLWQLRNKINQLPTTFIWGMKDIAFREKELNHWLSSWENAKVIRLDNVGHYPQEEAPEILIRELKEN
ncbi:MAG: alpha/beta fold hydrolase [Bacteroidetes bacterium]|nr:alpha/beta fold hydrolase [Bacteroidota bacterium]